MRVTQRLLAAAILLACAGTTLLAQEASTFEACYVPIVGAVYLVNQEGLPTECLDPSHVAFTWTAGDLSDGAVTVAKLAFDPATQAELDQQIAALSAGGTINESGNPVDWTQLKNVPDDFADGVDDSGAGATDHGVLTGLEDDDHPQYLLAGVRQALDGFAVTGTPGGGTVPVTGGGTRLMWYPGRAAFRAGRVNGSQWDAANVGDYSTATGFNTTASGNYSVAMGTNTTASGIYSFAMGDNTLASGSRAVAMGVSTTASGYYSTALGSSTTASGNITLATGYNTTASGLYATSMGGNTTASGVRSTAMGDWTTAQAAMSLVIGRFNVVAGDDLAWQATDPLFVAGNGTGDATRSNALTLLKNGDLTIAGTLTQNSDIRLKEDIEPVDHALDALLDLTPIRYRFREGTGHPTERQIGLSAQEVERAFPELVSQDSAGTLSVAYANLTALLIRALQEQQAQIDLLRSELDALRTSSAPLPRR